MLVAEDLGGAMWNNSPSDNPVPSRYERFRLGTWRQLTGAFFISAQD